MTRKKKLPPTIDANVWVNAIPIPVFALDHTNQIIFTNTAFEQLLGIKKANLLGSSLENALGKERSQKLLQHVLRAYSGTTTAESFKTDAVQKNGKHIRVTILLTPIFENKKRIVTNVVGIIEKVTKQPHLSFFSHLL